MSRKQGRIKTDLVLATCSHVAQKAVNVALLAVMARYFDQPTMGELFVAMAAALLMVMPTELGTHRHITRAVAGDRLRAAEHLGQVISLRLPLLAVGYITLNALGRLVSPELGVMLMLASLYTFLDSLYFTFGMTFIAMGRVGWHVLLYVVGQVLTLGLVVLAVVLGGSLNTVLAMYVGAGALMLGLGVATARRLIGPMPLAFDMPALGRLALATLPFFILGFLEMVLLKADTLMIWLLDSPLAVAHYESAYKFLEVSRFIVRPAGMIYLPVLVGLAAGRQWQSFGATVRRLLIASVAGGMVIAVGVIALAGSIMPLMWGQAYREATPILRVLFLTVPAFYLSFVAQILVTTLHLERRSIAVLGGAVLLNVALNALAIPRWGAIGAAWTTLVCECALAVGLMAIIIPAWRVARLPARTRRRHAATAAG